MQRLPSHSAPLVVDSLQMAFRIPGSGGPHLFIRHHSCLSGRWRTLNGITPASYRRAYGKFLIAEKRLFRLNAASAAQLSWLRQMEIQIRHLHFYIEPRQCRCLKESSSSWESCSLRYTRQPSSKKASITTKRMPTRLNLAHFEFSWLLPQPKASKQRSSPRSMPSSTATMLKPSTRRQEGLLLPPTQDLIRSLPISNPLIKLPFKQCQSRSRCHHYHLR
jgi:hypothetical protein